MHVPNLSLQRPRPHSTHMCSAQGSDLASVLATPPSARSARAPAGLAQTLDYLAPYSQNARATLTSIVPMSAAHHRRAIVVLGVPTLPNGESGPALKARIERAADALRAHEDAIAIPTGAAVMTHIVEADAIAQGLVACGIPANRILPERYAQTTQGNAQQVMHLVAQLGTRAPRELVLVVEPYQAVRALRAFVLARAQHTLPFVVTLSLALTDRICIEQAAVYVSTQPFRRTPLARTAVLKRLTVRQQQTLERMFNEKIKMGRGY